MCCGNNYRLPGAVFGIYDSCGHQLGVATTNNNGEIIFDCLPYGKYIIKELQAPDGYCKSTECAEVIINEHCTDKALEFINTRKTGSIKIIKYGKN